MARQALEGVDEGAASLVDEALDQAEAGTAALRELRTASSPRRSPDGHGLTGLRDRATALGGRLEVTSPDSGGTLVSATLPLPDA